MRLIVLTKYFGLNYTGATAATQQLISLWQKSVDNIDVITLHVGNCLPFDERVVSVEELPNPTSLRRKLAELGEADGYYNDDHLGTMLCGHHPFVHTYHGSWPEARHQSAKAFVQSLYFMPRYERIFRGCDMVVNVSRHSNVYTDQYTQNSTVIHNGLMSLPAPRPHASTGKRVLMVGSVCRWKYEHFASVGKRIHELLPQAQIDIYGNIVEESFAADLSEMPNVKLKGFCPKPPFWDYDILLCTSASENMPISICEALACGTPVVSFAVGGIAEVVTERRGYLVNPFDEKTLAERAVEALERSDWDVDAEAVREEFSWNTAAEQYLALFAKLSGSAS